MKRIRCHKVRFHSPVDEAAFFYFIKQIKAVHFVEGLSDDVFLHVKTPVSMKSLRDLLGLFKRYNIDLTELKPLKNQKNSTLFAGPGK